MAILRSKVVFPPLNPEYLSRPRLLAALEAGRSRRLTLVVAPAGYGKSRLLAEWCRSSAAHPTAWLSLDEYDNDPVSFWTYLVHALRQAYPDRFARSLAALGRAGANLTHTLLPPLLNELWGNGPETWLVVDDFQVITNPACLESFRFFVEQLPARCHLVLASRTEPPLDLPRLRARGQLSEIRAGELSFTLQEARRFLNGTLKLELPSESVARLEVRTEGWAAGLYLAALSLRDHPDPEGFVAAFAGQHRHLVDYFGLEVLERLSEADRRLLVQTAVLDRLSGSLCDTLLDTDDAAQRLRRLAQQNLFVFPLDESREWYRCHPLFHDLLASQLRRRFSDRLPELHRRAAAWYAAVGDADRATQQAHAAGDERLIGDLFLAHAQPSLQQGRLATVTAWLATLPEAALAARPALALATAWIAGEVGRPPAEISRRVELAEAGPDEGPFPLGEPSLAAAVTLIRTALLVDDVGAVLAAGEAAVAACVDPETLAYGHARRLLGEALYVAGRPAEARVLLESFLRTPFAPRQFQAVSRTLALLSLVSLALGEEARAGELARRAMQVVDEYGLAAVPSLWICYGALGRVLLREGRSEAAAAVLVQGVEPQLERLRAWPVLHALALLTLVELHRAQGQDTAARARLEEAQAALQVCRDAGVVAGLLAELEQDLTRQSLPPTGLREVLSEGELRVLRLLATDLTQQEIGRELYLSHNTVKAHSRRLYSKLDAGSRAEAVARARALGFTV